MNSSSVKLLYNTKEWLVFTLLLSCIFSISIFKEYQAYKAFRHHEIVSVHATVLNIYPKEKYCVIKFKTDTFEAFTSVPKTLQLKQQSQIRLLLISQSIDFIDFLSGFYATNVAFSPLKEASGLKTSLMNHIQTQHDNPLFTQLYNALFFAIPISKELREICTHLGISHLIAISGFHLGLISLILYGIISFFYGSVHQRFFPYRNKKMDILCFSSIFLLSYLLFTNNVPSLLRAFVMFVLGTVLLRSNIKLLSFETLGLTVLSILALFPGFVFSLSFWFSVWGVFYIFLFIQYFQNMSKVGQLLLFNVWIYLAMNPITHYYFGTTSYLQLFSPFLTLLFTLFYPLSAVLHIVGWGGALDGYVIKLFEVEAYPNEVLTPLWFLIVYVVCSLLAIKKRLFFMVLNGFLILFSLTLYGINIQQVLE